MVWYQVMRTLDGLRKRAAPAEPAKAKEATPKKKDAKSSARVDPEAELMQRQRTVFINGSIDHKVAKTVIAQLLYLDSLVEPEAAPKPIRLIIHSGGGASHGRLSDNPHSNVLKDTYDYSFFLARWDEYRHLMT